MRLLLGTLFSLTVAAAIGLGATWLALTRGHGLRRRVRSAPGPPGRRPAPPDIDPYARATIARSGELPIGSGDGVAFYRPQPTTAGTPLDGRCDVTW